MKVLSVASEIYPLVKTGGLGDVIGALPAALEEQGVDTVTLVPGYPAVLAGLEKRQAVLAFDDLFGGSARLLSGRADRLKILAIDAPHLYERPGSPYLGPDGRDWPDNALRFAALGCVAARIGLGDLSGYIPDVVHCHDWHAALAPVYLAYGAGRPPPTVVTVHNLAYQGLFPAGLLHALRLPDQVFHLDGLEYYGSIGFLKGGLQFADRITTVSPTYAQEMQTPEFGFGLDGLLRARAPVIFGIRNGIDITVWNPLRDTLIPASYGRSTLRAREKNKTELRSRLGLVEEVRSPVLGVVSRLVPQKGLDLVADAANSFLERGAQLAVLGSGDASLEQRFAALAAENPGRIACVFGYDEPLAHLIQAAADAILIPSRFEPCGLTQLCALRYGAIPVGARVGGLADTIVDPEATGGDSATGFLFSPVTREGLETALARVLNVWPDRRAWCQMQVNGMRTDVSWKGPAKQYARLYDGLITTKI